MPKAKIPVSTLRRCLPQIPVNVTNVALKETQRLGDLSGPDKRADVYFGGTITVNGRLLPVELHLFRVDKDGWQSGSWYTTLNVNENKNWEKDAIARGVPKRDVFYHFPQYCKECHKESYVGIALAKAIFPMLREKGFNLASGIGYKGRPCDWWLMDITVDKQGERIVGGRARQFTYKQRQQVTCPIHGEFIQETEESSL